MSKRNSFSCALVTLVACALMLTHAIAPVSLAADGDLDTTYGQGGVVSTLFPYPLDGTVYADAVQSDGKIVLVGEHRNAYGDAEGFAVLRLNPNGSPDTSFGRSGTALTTFGAPGAASGSIAIQPDGKIIAAGYYTPDSDFYYEEYALARFLPDGTLDTTFGTGGKVLGATGDGTLINGLVLLPGGKILVAGSKGAGNNKMWIARFNADGSPDGTFGTGGSATIPCNQPVAGAQCEGYALAVQSDGKALVGGTARFIDNGTNRRYFAVSRFTSGGQVDTTFGTGGLATTQIGDVANVYALGVTDTGKVVAVGNACCTGGGLAIARYNSNGTPDTGFGTGGKLVVEGASAGYSLLMRSGGKIALAGSVSTGSSGVAGSMDTPDTSGARFSFGSRPGDSSGEGEDAPQGTGTVYHFAVMQFNSDGSFDNNFGTGGKVYTDFGGARDAGTTIAQAPDGKLVAAGRYIANEGERPMERFAVARYSASGSPDTGFGGRGKTLVSPLTSYSEFSNVEVQGDSKALALGRIETLYYPDSGSVLTTTYALLRYNSNGTPDTGFGTGGKSLLSIRGSWTDMSLQNNGKMVLGGTLNNYGPGNYFALTRLNQNGSLDTGFGNNGLVTTSFTFPYNSLSDIAVLADGRIIAVGSTTDQNQNDVAMARYNPDGSLDTTFGSGGKVVTRLGKYARASTLAVQADGKIVLAGSAPISTANDDAIFYRITAVRYNANGSWDTSFGSGGVVKFTQIDGYAEAESVAIQADQKIVVAGRVNQQGTTSGIVIRWNPNGTLDTSFDNGGSVLFAVRQLYVSVIRVLVQSDSKLVVSTRADPSIPGLLRYNPNGSLDASFGNGGTVNVPTLTFNDIDLQPDGKIVAAGTYTGGRYPAFALARFGGNQPALTPTPTLPPTGAQFQDVPADSPFYAYISCMAERNIISGYPCGGPGEDCGATNGPYFRPNDSMTRGQVSKIVSIAANFNEALSGQTFQDVAPGSTFYEYVERMAARGIISGYPCGAPGEECVAPGNRPYYRPGANVSRGQLTKIVSNARGYTDPPTEQTFEDVPTTNAFYLFVERLASRGVMSGYGCGGPGEPCRPPANRAYFRPALNVTRGQASKIVANSFFPHCQPATSLK